MRKRYYKVWIDSIQSLWLVIEQKDKIIELYMRPAFSYSGTLRKSTYFGTIPPNYKEAYKTQEISQNEAFIELL